MLLIYRMNSNDPKIDHWDNLVSDTVIEDDNLSLNLIDYFFLI